MVTRSGEMALLWNKKEVAVVLFTMLNITAVLCVPNESDERHRHTFTAFMKPVKGFHWVCAGRSGWGGGFKKT